MTIRRFLVLVRGLGPHSATATRLAARHYFGERSARETSTPAESETALASFFGRPPGRVN